MLLHSSDQKDDYICFMVLLDDFDEFIEWLETSDSTFTFFGKYFNNIKDYKKEYKGWNSVVLYIKPHDDQLSLVMTYSDIINWEASSEIYRQ